MKTPNQKPGEIVSIETEVRCFWDVSSALQRSLADGDWLTAGLSIEEFASVAAFSEAPRVRAAAAATLRRLNTTVPAGLRATVAICLADTRLG